jgi:negative regulator of flagellin synthesis FlgM
MKINDSQSIQPTDVGGAAAVGRARPRPAAPTAGDATPATKTGAAPAAKVELSARSRELHEALKAARSAPDVRADLVKDVRARVTDGTYRVDPELIARRILDTEA